MTKYPIYVITKGRWDSNLTAKFLIEDKVDFHLVVEPQQFDEYAKSLPSLDPSKILKLPFSNLGLGGIPARNWVWEHAKSSGAERHWILDDNIRRVRRLYKGKRIPCDSEPAFRAIEEFTDRYENVAISGMNYTFFARAPWLLPPFYLNVHVYSCLLILNSLQQRWRGRYNEDTDLCLQVLSDNWCTILTNAFLIEKMATMTMKGGNTGELYQGDGRLKMARSLERQWPGVVSVSRRFQRPQHIVKDGWKRFDTQLKFKPGVSIQGLKPNEFGLRLKAVGEVKSDGMKKLLSDSDRDREVPEQ